jgi:predicted GIY-YIG superfamily endonuclease
MAVFFTYILKCQDGRRYFGHTQDLRHRLDQHRRGEVRSTRWRRPVELVWFHIYATCAGAREREWILKNGHTCKKTLEEMIHSFPKVALEAFNLPAVKGDACRLQPDTHL